MKLAMYFLSSLVAAGAFVMPAHANNNWLPNVVDYINGKAADASGNLRVPVKNQDGKFSISWPDFGAQTFELEFKEATDNQWSTLYVGESNYFIHATSFITGDYQFRLNCSGYSQCPADGYLTGETSVVIAPAYVNSRYDPENNEIGVYWAGQSKAQGFVLEQSDDNGLSWYDVTPETGAVSHSSDDHNGQLHSANEATLNPTNAPLAKSIASLSKAIQSVSAKNTVVSSGYRYRVRTCTENACSEYSTSNTLRVDDLVPIYTDPGFEAGVTSFTVSEGGGLSALTNQEQITGDKSLHVTLKNWGYLENIHWFPSPKPLGGVSLTGKMRLKQLTPGNKLSVYAVAYYDGIDKRNEGTRFELDASDVSDSTIHQLFSTLYLDNSIDVKYVRYYVRLIGSGTATFVLDDAQLYEGTHIGQDYPVLTSYLSSYSGNNKLSWTAFSYVGARFNVEYKNLNSGIGWQPFYRGSELSFSSPESDPENNPVNYSDLLDSGEYVFRIDCRIAGNDCPDNYVYAYLVVARESAWLNTNYNVSNGLLGLAWAETVAAYGYLIEEKFNDGDWLPLEPGSGDNTRSYRGNLLYTDNYTLLSGRTSGTYQYRVRACRSSGCNGQWREGDAININNVSSVLSFYVPISEYDGLLNTYWTAFKPLGQNYTVEHRLDSGNWEEWYSGSGSSYTNNEPLAEGNYHFRLECSGYTGCPASGYLESFSLVAPKPAFLYATYNESTFVVDLNWSSTVSAYGYVLERQINDGVWEVLTPQAGEPSRIHGGNNLFTATSTSLAVIKSGIHRFRVKACRSSRCGSEYATALLDLDLTAIVEWKYPIVTAGQANELLWPSAIVSNCVSLDASPITLTPNENGEQIGKLYLPETNRQTRWSCTGLNNEPLGEFVAPVSIEKLSAPEGLATSEN